MTEGAPSMTLEDLAAELRITVPTIALACHLRGIQVRNRLSSLSDEEAYLIRADLGIPKRLEIRGLWREAES
jgi:hypothetical protein